MKPNLNKNKVSYRSLKPHYSEALEAVLAKGYCVGISRTFQVSNWSPNVWHRLGELRIPCFLWVFGCGG